MALYTELSPQDQGIVDNLVNFVRAGSGEVARVFNHLKAIADDANGLAIFATLDAGAVVPNKSGLAGADDMTATELATLFNLMESVRQVVDLGNGGASVGVPNPPFRAQATKASGINAMLG